MNDDETDAFLAGAAHEAQERSEERAARSADSRRPSPNAADSFRRSDAYLAGQIARAVARGQRVL